MTYDPDIQLGGYDNPNPPYTDDAWAMVSGAFPGKQPAHIPGQLSLDDEARREMIRRDRLARAEAIGRSIRPNYTGD